MSLVIYLPGDFVLKSWTDLLRMEEYGTFCLTCRVLTLVISSRHKLISGTHIVVRKADLVHAFKGAGTDEEITVPDHHKEKSCFDRLSALGIQRFIHS